MLSNTTSIKIYFLPHATQGISSEIYFSSPKIHNHPSIYFWENQFQGHREENRISEHQKRDQCPNSPLGPFMISKYFKLAPSLQSLQEQWCEKFLAQWKWEQVKALSMCVGAVELCRTSLSHGQEKILPWMLEIKKESPHGFNEQ